MLRAEYKCNPRRQDCPRNGDLARQSIHDAPSSATNSQRTRAVGLISFDCALTSACSRRREYHLVEALGNERAAAEAGR
jgi:hypothetical protein